MAPMTTLDETYMLKQPVRHRFRRLDTPEFVHYYGLTYDNYPEPDGTFELGRRGGQAAAHRPALGESQFRQCVHDPVGLQAERQDPANQVDDVAGLFVLARPVVRVIHDPRRFVRSDLVPLDDPVHP